MDAVTILKNAKWNSSTVYQDQLTFVGPDKKVVSVVRSKEGMTRKEAEEALIDRVQALYI